MKNCNIAETVFLFVIIIITLPVLVNPINNMITKFLKNTIDILESESIPIILYGNSSHNYDIFAEMPFFMSVTSNLTQAYCDKGLRNHSGILLASLATVSDAINFLSQLSEIEPSCNCIGFYPKVFLILDNNESSTYYSPFAEEVESKLSSSVQDWNFSVDSDVYIALNNHADTSSSSERMRLLEVYRIMNHSVIQEVEFPQEENYTTFTLEGLSSRNRRLNFYGQTIRGILYKDDPISPRIKASIPMTREVFEDMAVILNFKFIFVFGDSWIRFAANGSPQGVAKLLENSEGDILGQAHEISIERQSKFDFIYPNYNFRETVFFRQPTRVYPNLIFQPYALDAWISFIWSFFILSICFGLVTRTLTEKKLKRMRKYNIIFKVFGLFCQQGWLENPTTASKYNLSIKAVIFAGFILSSFFYNLYAASIISIISLREPPIKTAEQLLQSGAKIFVDIDARNAHRYLDKLTNMEKRQAIKSTEDGISIVSHNLSASVAFISYKHYVLLTDIVQKKLTFQEFCKSISQIGMELKGLPIHNGMYVKKHSPYRKLFLHSQIRRAEIGSVIHQKNKLAKSSNPVCLQTKEDVESLGLAVVLPIFILSFSITLCSFVVLIFEIVFDYFLKQQHIIHTIY